MNTKSLKVLEFHKIIEKLISFAVSAPGKELAAALAPFNDMNKIKSALKETDDSAAFIARRGSPPMSDIADIRPSIKRIEIGGALGFSELLNVCGVLRLCRRLKEYGSIAEDTDDTGVVSSMIQALYSNKRLEEHISNCILSEDEMADDASPELYSIRRQIRDRQNSIKDKLNDLIRSPVYSKYMQDTVVTLRGDRYVIPVKIEYKQHFPGIVHDTSASGQTLFIEPMAVVEANNKIRELHGKEQEEIERVLYMLTAEVDEVKTELMQDQSIVTDLDFIFAKGKLSLEMRAVSPFLNDEHKIKIINGRHPLISKDKVVPINFWIGDGFDSLIITGPNTGGKTVTLKTVGLFTLMTQAGLHIPADEGTKMSMFKTVYADIGDEQSIEQSLSTFSSHMKNIVDILQETDENSLVLFDELGAGTDPTEGAALAMSILERLHNKGCTSIATTHYSELKVYAISTPGFENACCEFNVNTLMPTYKLLIGVPGKSNAFAISEKLGLENGIISRAKEFLTAEDLKFEDLLMDIEKNREESEREREEIKRLKGETESLKKEIENKRETLLKERETYLRKAKEEAMEIINKTKEESNQLLTEMRKLSFVQKNSVELKEAENIKKEINLKYKNFQGELFYDPLGKSAKGVAGNFDGLDEFNEFNDFGDFDGNDLQSLGGEELKKVLKEGTAVKIISLGHEGVVLRSPDAAGNALVQAGVMKVKIHASNLELVREKKKDNNKPASTGGGRGGSRGAGGGNSESIRNTGNKNSFESTLNLKREIDVRGCTVDEAVNIIDKFIDDALRAHFSPISVIHGKGTGALRAGIHEFLRKHKSVKKFRLGEIGEGDAGVTVIELKV